jgi:cysteine dioxygenase
MSKLLTTHPLHTTIQDFIAGLRSTEQDLITKTGVLRYLSDVNLPLVALSPYIFWRESFYTRNPDLVGTNCLK